jgi:phosphocarrier protein HPr
MWLAKSLGAELLSLTSEKVSQDVTICNRRGLHARASAKFAKQSGSFDARIEVCKDDMCVVGTSIMGLMMLGAAKGDVINIAVSGTDCEKALQALCALVDDKFGENE